MQSVISSLSLLLSEDYNKENCKLVSSAVNEAQPSWPKFKKSKWTPEEDDIILIHQEKISKKWSIIAKCFPERMKIKWKPLESTLKKLLNGSETELKLSRVRKWKWWRGDSGDVWRRRKRILRNENLHDWWRTAGKLFWLLAIFIARVVILNLLKLWNGGRLSENIENCGFYLKI